MVTVRVGVVAFVLFRLLFPTAASAQDRATVEGSQQRDMEIGRSEQIHRGRMMELMADLRSKLQDVAVVSLAGDPGVNEQKASSSIVLVPTSANVPGAFGSFFRTRLTLYNPTPSSYPISISLFGQNGLVAKKTYQIGADAGFTWGNFLDDFFAYSGAGALLFESQGTSPNYKFTVRSEVYNLSSSGTFSTVVPAIELTSVSVPATGSQPYFAMNGGINVNSFRRTNLGCVNYSSASAEILAFVVNSSGAMVQELTFTMQPFSWKQLPITAQLSNGLVAWGSLRPITAFMVEVDNTSNDGSYFVATSFENLF